MNLRNISETRWCAKHKAGIVFVFAVVAYALFDTLMTLLLEFLHASFETIEYALDDIMQN